jgi:biotin transport system substrate-specific component
MILEKNINSKLAINLLTYFSLIVFGSIILVLSAKTKVPFYPVPMTMQTFVIMLFGFIFGWKKACLIISAYLLEGAAGLPVFAGTPEKGIGLAYMTGPTGGYILGFLFTAYLSGKLNFKTGLVQRIIKLTLSVLPIYFIGCLWLGFIIGWDKPIVSIGVLPFILAEFFKVFLLALLIPKINFFNKSI